MCKEDKQKTKQKYLDSNVECYNNCIVLNNNNNKLYTYMRRYTFIIFYCLIEITSYRLLYYMEMVILQYFLKQSNVGCITKVR